MSATETLDVDPHTLRVVLLYLDGVATADQMADLAARLRSSDIDRRQVARLLLQVGLLEQVAHARGGVRSFETSAAVEHAPTASPPTVAPASASRQLAWHPQVSRPPASRHPTARRTAWIATSALAAALAGLFVATKTRQPDLDTAVSPTSALVAAGTATARPPHFLAPPTFRDGSLARVQSLAGRAFALAGGQRRALEPGAVLLPTDRIETQGPTARVTLSLADGTSLELRGEGLVSWALTNEMPRHAGPRVRVNLERGTAVASVPKSEAAPTIVFVTPRAEIHVSAGQTRFEVERDITKVRQRSGAAEVRRLSDGQRLEMEPGRTIAISDTAAALVAVDEPRALLVRGAETELDRLISARLESAGFAVTAVAEAALDASDLTDSALVVISSSSAGPVLAARLSAINLRDAAIPVVNCESLAFAPLAMTTRQGVGRKIAELIVEQPSHPLAAGRSGKVRIATVPIAANWALPASGAIGVVKLKTPRLYAVFAYERGMPMAGVSAPARRVSCFLDPKRPEPLTEAAWDLFDAAVRWAAELPAPERHGQGM